MTIFYELAKKEDLPTIVAIYNQTISLQTVTADLHPVTVAERTAWFDSFTADKYPLWVIKSNQEIIGWLDLSPFYGREAYQHTAEISIYLDQKARGQHIGSQALKFAEIQLKALNLENVVAFIFKQNEPSIRLFTKSNFSQWGFLPQVAEIEGKLLDLVIMGKHFS